MQKYTGARYEETGFDVPCTLEEMEEGTRGFLSVEALAWRKDAFPAGHTSHALP